MSRLLIDDQPLIVLPKLAMAVGLNEAIVLQQIHFWTETYKAIGDPHHYQDGEWWVWNSLEGWTSNFPFWSDSTVRRTLESLRKAFEPVEGDAQLAHGPLLVTGQFNRKGYDRTLWYRIDYEELGRIEEVLAAPSAQNEQMDLPKMSGPIPEITTESTTENTQIDVPPQILWTDARAELKLQMTAATFNTWLAPCREIEIHPPGDSTGPVEVVILCPTEYIQDWLTNRLNTPIQRTLAGLLQRPVHVVYRAGEIAGAQVAAGIRGEMAGRGVR